MYDKFKDAYYQTKYGDSAPLSTKSLIDMNNSLTSNTLEHKAYETDTAKQTKPMAQEVKDRLAYFDAKARRMGFKDSAAVTAFQRKHKLNIDGDAGREVLNKLNAIKLAKAKANGFNSIEEVRKWQSDNGLKADGDFGSASRRKMAELKAAENDKQPNSTSKSTTTNKSTTKPTASKPVASDTTTTKSTTKPTPKANASDTTTTKPKVVPKSTSTNTSSNDSDNVYYKDNKGTYHKVGHWNKVYYNNGDYAIWFDDNSYSLQGNDYDDFVVRLNQSQRSELPGSIYSDYDPSNYDINTIRALKIIEKYKSNNN